MVRGITSHWWMKNVDVPHCNVQASPMVRWVTPSQPLSASVGSDDWIHDSFIMKMLSQTWSVSSCWEWKWVADGSVGMGFDIIVEYAWNEFYTEHLPQVSSRDAKHTGDIITFAIYAFPRFHLITKFRCSSHTASVSVFDAWLQSKSVLPYVWQFTAKHFILASSPLRLMTTSFSFQLNSSGNSPHVTSSLTIRWVCLSWICLAFRQAYVSHL
jgi:hypothetical protein